MKITNEKKKMLFQLIDTFFILLFLVLIVSYFLDIVIKPHQFYPLLIASTLVFLLYKFMGTPFFIYDSEGETIAITNKKNSLLTGGFLDIKKADFPKRKLISYKVTDYIIKKNLELTLSSKRSEAKKTKLKFNITYLSLDETRKLKKSLSKIINNNKKEEV